MDTNKNLHNNNDFTRLDKLFQYVHARIEEKFKDFRVAFRAFDKNFDGCLNFKEFITGMENIGIKLKIPDYKLIFDTIDYDNEGEIDFSKFCLLNTDRKRDIQKLRQENTKSPSKTKSSLNSQQKKPPLPKISISGKSTNQTEKSEHTGAAGGGSCHPLFGDGNIPKNKDMNSFTKDIQQETDLRSYLKKRFQKSAHKEGFKTVEDIPESHIYGKSSTKGHDMVALLTNSYSDGIQRISIENLRNSLVTKRVLPAKPTYAQLIREKMNRLRYSLMSPLSNPDSHHQRSNSVSTGKLRIPRNFVIKGNNNFSQSSVNNSNKQFLI